MKAKWTVMIYMAGDNNLDSAALEDIEAKNRNREVAPTVFRGAKL